MELDFSKSSDHSSFPIINCFNYCVWIFQLERFLPKGLVLLFLHQKMLFFAVFSLGSVLEKLLISKVVKKSFPSLFHELRSWFGVLSCRSDLLYDSFCFVYLGFTLGSN